MSIRILRLPDVLDKTGLGRSSVYALVSRGAFPRPVRIASRAIGWQEAEIERWLKERIAESRAEDSAA